MDRDAGASQADMASTAVELEPGQLRRLLDPASLPFDSTAEVDSLKGTVGQPRAVDALEFGLGIHTVGYNLFVTGAPGSGRATAVLDHLRRWSAERPTPGDWVYVNNFLRPSQPVAISLPPGRGVELAADMDAFIGAVRRDLDRAFEGDAYQQHRRDRTAEIEGRRQELSHELDAVATARGFALQATPFGIAVVPVRDGQPLSAKEVNSMPDDERAALERASREIQERLEAHAHQVRQLEKEAAEKLAELDRTVVLAAVAPAVAGLRLKYQDQPAVLDHLGAVEADVPDHLGSLRRRERRDDDGSAEAVQQRRPSDDGARYRVNVLVDNRSLRAAPVVVERNPTLQPLRTGRVRVPVWLSGHRLQPCTGGVVASGQRRRPGPGGGGCPAQPLLLGGPQAHLAVCRGRGGEPH